MLKLLMLALVFIAPAAFAEVTSKGESGFNLKISRDIKTSAGTAYTQFLRVDEWWIKGHTWFGSADNLFIEPKAGGCFCEIDGKRQVHHMLVTFADPGREIKMTGGLGPLQMMGVYGGMSWRFEEDESGSRIVLSYNVTGFAPGGLMDLAEVVDAVLTAQVNALADKLESES